MCTQLAATSDKVYQLLAHGRWFSPGTPVKKKLNKMQKIQIKKKVKLLVLRKYVYLLI
jgi:hypothetical protein